MNTEKMRLSRLFQYQRQETWDAKDKYKHKIKERREAAVSSIQDHSAKLIFLIKTAIIMFKPSNSTHPFGLYRSKGAYPTQVTTNSSCTLIMQFKFRVEQLNLSHQLLSWPEFIYFRYKKTNFLFFFCFQKRGINQHIHCSCSYANNENNSAYWKWKSLLQAAHTLSGHNSMSNVHP